MGSQNTKAHSSQRDWQKVDTDNGIQIFRNRFNNELAQKRIITLDSEDDIQEELNVYNMRERNNDALVRTLCTKNLDPNSSASGLCSGQRKIFVFTEKMPHRLSECPQLTFPQSLLFMRQTLRAFERIYKEYGPVQITKDLIGINYLGEVKSWLNENWALNHRGHEYLNIRSAKVEDLTRDQYLAFRGQYLDEPQMVRTIISVIESKCEDGKFPQAFKEEVQNQSGSFKKLLLYLKDFIDYNDISVPDRINYQTLVHSNYRVRLQHQLNPNHQTVQHYNSQANNTNGFGQFTHSQANNTNNFGANQSQQYAMGSQFNNQDFIKNMFPQQNGYQMNGQTVSQNTIRPNLQHSLSETNKQSPASDTLGHVTFSQANRVYNGQSRMQGSSKKDTGYGQSLTYSTGGKIHEWSSNLQGLSKPYNEQLNGNYGINSMNNKNPITTESKYQFYTSTGYKPYQPTYESSVQPLAFESTLMKPKLESSLNNYNAQKLESSFNNFNGGNLDAQGSKYSYNYSSSYADSGKLSGYGNSANTNNYTVTNNLNTLSGSSPLNLPISTYSSNYNSGYQSSLSPISNQNNSVKPYSKSSAYQTQGQRLAEGYSNQHDVRNEQDYSKFSEKAILIDGLTGQIIGNNAGGIFAIGPMRMDNSRDGAFATGQRMNGQNYQNKNSIGYSSTHGLTGIRTQQNKWETSLPTTYTETYNHITTVHTPTQSREPPTNNPSTQTISTFSFGSKFNNESRFGTGYIGTGYSNSLAKYQPTTNLNTQLNTLPNEQHSTTLPNNLNLEGKYAEAFTSLLSPKLTGIIGQQNYPTPNNIQSPQTQVNTNTTNKQTPTSIDKQKPLSSNLQASPISQPETTQKQSGPNTMTNTFEGFSNIVERVSNEVTESVLRQG